MWKAYQAMKVYHRRPSDDLCPDDEVAAWCLDDAVLWFGLTIEGLLSERTNIGTPDKPKWQNKYTLAQLLDPRFIVPKPPPTPKAQAENGLGLLMVLAGQPGSGVKRYEYVKPS